MGGIVAGTAVAGPIGGIIGAIVGGAAGTAAEGDGDAAEAPAAISSPTADVHRSEKPPWDPQAGPERTIEAPPESI